MDDASILVLEGHGGQLPTVNVTGSAKVGGQLILRPSLPPNFSSYGQSQNYTIMKCGIQCIGGWQLAVEDLGECNVVKDVRQFRQAQSALMVAVTFGKSELCFSSKLLPPLLLLAVVRTL